MMITIKTTKTIYIEDLVHHVGRSLIRKILSRVKTTFKGAHNLNCELGEAIASNSVDITNE